MPTRGRRCERFLCHRPVAGIRDATGSWAVRAAGWHIQAAGCGTPGRAGVSGGQYRHRACTTGTRCRLGPEFARVHRARAALGGWTNGVGFRQRGGAVVGGRRGRPPKTRRQRSGQRLSDHRADPSRRGVRKPPGRCGGCCRVDPRRCWGGEADAKRGRRRGRRRVCRLLGSTAVGSAGMGDGRGGCLGVAIRPSR